MLADVGDRDCWRRANSAINIVDTGHAAVAAAGTDAANVVMEHYDALIVATVTSSKEIGAGSFGCGDIIDSAVPGTGIYTTSTPCA